VSAVWSASRAAVRRRRLQTIVIGAVVGLAACLSVVALGLLAASSGPFDQAYARLRGAHVVAAFDPAKVSTDQLTRAAQQPQVEAVAGPYAQAVVEIRGVAGVSPPTSLALVGRADPGGAVDRLNLWKGRWVAGPGEIVLAGNPTDSEDMPLGTKLPVADGPALTVVGIAYSVSGSANGWVTPAQAAALHPTGVQMLYRFQHAATAAEVEAGQAAVTAGLAPTALLASRSYLTLKTSAAAQPGTFVPFLIVFGCLGLAVAVLIVANVVSGAVVAGFKHIGMLKALGFTPTQVLAVYLSMVSIPAIAGAVLGTVLGTVLAEALVTNAFKYWGSDEIGVSAWVVPVVLLGMPVVVGLSALVPALRARSLPAAQAISAGSAQHSGRASRVQRWLAGTRLPRAISLGLGLPLARPARSAMTMAAVVLGVTSVTFAIGLAASVTGYENADPDRAVQVNAHVDEPSAGGTDNEALLRSLPGTKQVTASADLEMLQVGTTAATRVRFWRGDAARERYQVLQGHWFDGPGQVAVSARFLAERGLAVGDTLTLQRDGTRTQVRIVAELLVSSSAVIFSNWATLAQIAPGTEPDSFEVQLTPGTDVSAYVGRAMAAAPSLEIFSGDDTDAFIVIIVATVTALTLMLGAVAALGVFNTVVLNTRERRRDLGMLKSIGMTPGQVTAMMVTSMAALGAVSGLIGIPIGVAAHGVVLPAMARSAQVRFPASVLHVYHPPLLMLLALAGVAIAALGALVPARSAARATIAEVLHNE